MRKGALQTLKIYVKAVSGARKASMMAVVGIVALSSVAIGFFMLIGGLLWLANLNPQAYPWIMVGVGALLTFAGVTGFILAFRQKMWVEMSRIHELTQAALTKFPVDDRLTNPAVSAMWAMAAEARIRETTPAPSGNPEAPTPRLDETSFTESPVHARPAPIIEPTMQPI